MSSISCGIVGLPNVGKSTLFNALTGSSILAANYPFATIEPNTGIVPVPDERLAKLSVMYGNAPIKPATITFVDIAGLVAGASQGEGLGNQFLSHIRSCNAIAHVVRAFEGGPVTRVEGSSGPADDIAVINTELILADLQTVEHHLPKLQKETKSNPKLRPQVELLEDIKQTLDGDQPIFARSDFDKVRDGLQEMQLQLLTAKPVIYVFNVSEAQLADESQQHKLRELVAPSQALFVNAQLESELHALDPADASEMLASYGQQESGLIKLIGAAYDTLGLQSYLTAGDKEVRAWTIPRGATAPQAAGVIHGDFERGFVAAQVVDYDDLIAAGSEAAAKSAGKVRTEGKDYVMQPGDVVEFRFNVSK